MSLSAAVTQIKELCDELDIDRADLLLWLKQNAAAPLAPGQAPPARPAVRAAALVAPGPCSCSLARERCSGLRRLTRWRV